MSDPAGSYEPGPQAYRPDIDGLRAIAVVSVVIGHTFEEALPGGFLGVDVFFVISGYVITMSLLGRDHARFGAFLGAFFLRRIKRLIPALLLMFLITCAVVFFLDRDPNVSLITGALSLIGMSNFSLYAQELDYFSASIKYNAFTHTWSLGVEEQFYLLFPVLFWVVFATQSPRRVVAMGAVVLGLSILSLIIFIALQDTADRLAYYMMPFRFWELGAGVVAAFWVDQTKPTVGGMRSLKTALALLALGCVFVIAGPGVMAGHVVAVFMTVTLLVGGAGGPQAIVLTNPVSVYIGRISYSLYLWHWPFLTFGLLAPTSLIAKPLVAIAGAFGAAVLSYHFVEQPVRRLRTPVPKLWHFATAFCGVSAAIILILTANEVRKVVRKAFPLPFYTLPDNGMNYNPTCVVDEKMRLLLPDTFTNCTFPPKGEETRTLWVVGDSHAGHLQGGMVTLRDTHGFGFHLIETPGLVYPVTKDHGFASRDALMEDVRANWKPGDVLVLSRLFFRRTDTFDLAADVPEWMGMVDRLALELAKADVDLLLMGPPPMFRFEDIRACDPNDWLSCSVPRKDLAPAIDQVHEMLAVIAARHENTELFESFAILCPPLLPACAPATDGVFQYRDRDHLNVAGAGALVPGWAAVLERMR